ncbi:hypothetical protein BZA05DRAFT_382297 [Tricharina praecox]|uniref:uncharacterized protein n=1 Tax=Tricharina praecox TaxID=43433 RepID=UPI00221FB92E|nr:uncharacterized protein BZA05DRAFT_382297 [Tricharina praecox]KAI5858737.1 hypothetical protein BZA05DRAFT_382297 [Tricharina praecox]
MSASTTILTLYFLLLTSTQLTSAHLIKRKGAGGGGGGARGGGSFTASGGGGGGSGGSESLTHDQWSLIFIIVGTICGVIVSAIVGVRVYWCIRTRRRAVALRQQFEKHARYPYASSDSSTTKLSPTAMVGVRKPERMYLRF